MPRSIEELQQARLIEQNSASQLAEREGELVKIRKTKDTREQLFGPQDPYFLELSERLRDIEEEVETLREANQAAKANLDSIKAEIFQNESESQWENMSLDFPILFFPVRLETKYVTLINDGEEEKELRVRIYPDGILIDSHEPLLTEKEHASGLRYWRDTFARIVANGEQTAWTKLVNEYNPTRAAWIVNQTEPTNLGAYQRFVGNREQEEPEEIEPEFEEIPTRSNDWRRKPKTDLLPDYWVAINEENEILGVSQPVREPLFVSMNWQGSLEEQRRWTNIADSDLPSDPDVEWTYNFDAAYQAGMAIKIGQERMDVSNNYAFKRIIVFGVCTTMNAEESSEEIEKLFDKHHFSRSFSFLKQGTPTNNTDERPSGYPPADPLGQRSFLVERGTGLAHERSDGRKWARAMGVSPDLVQQVEGADLEEQLTAEAMVNALFPVTLGMITRSKPDYFRMTGTEGGPYNWPSWSSWLGTLFKFNDKRTYEHTANQGMLENHLDTLDEEALDHFSSYVRGRGPFLSFRTGSVPYGLLPTTIIDSAETRMRGHVPPFERFFCTLIEDSPRTRKHWSTENERRKEYLERYDPYRHFFWAISQTASAREFYFREMDNFVLVENRATTFPPGRPGFPVNPNFPPILNNPLNPNDPLGPIGPDNPLGPVNPDGPLGPNRPGGPLGPINLGDLPGSIRPNIPLGSIIPPTNSNAPGIPGIDGTSSYLPIPWLKEFKKFNCGIVDFKIDGVENLSETDPLPNNYIRWLLDSDIDTLITEHYSPEGNGDSTPSNLPLLYLVLRRALLTKYIRISVDILLHQGVIDELAADSFFYKLNFKIQGREDIYDYLDDPIPELTGNLSLGTFLLTRPSDQNIPDQIQIWLEQIDNYRSYLEALADLPTAELERLFTETMDVFSYRKDAWSTSMATRYLDQLRQNNPVGSYFACYGWVENLRPISEELPEDSLPQLINIEGEENVFTGVNSDGYLYAPSMQHASAAAILRNAHLEFDGKDSSAFTINLSSQRVRKAMWILDGLREGQSLGAILGYLFERGLHDARLNHYIDQFREVAPIVANKINPENGPVEQMAARNVVDGYQIMVKWRDENFQFPFPVSETLERHLNELEDCMDAVSDLLLSESVYQMVSGNTDGIHATLKSTSEGRIPPSPEIIKTPRSGRSIQFSFGFLFNQEILNAGVWTENGTSRSRMAPFLNAWISRLLVDPNKMKVRVWFDGQQEYTELSMHDLEIEPLDLLYLSEREETVTSFFQDRLVWKAKEVTGNNHLARIQKIQYQFTPDLSDELNFAQVFELVNNINSLLSHARPVLPKDFVLSERNSSYDPLELFERVEEIKKEYRSAIIALSQTLKADDDNQGYLSDPILSDVLLAVEEIVSFDLSSLNNLYASYSGLAGEGGQSFVIKSRFILEELESKWEKIESISEALSQKRLEGSLSAEHEIELLTSIVQVMFGGSFVVLPRFFPHLIESLDVVWNNQPDLGYSSSDEAIQLEEKEELFSRWLNQIAMIRKPISTWKKYQTYAFSAGNSCPLPDIIQLPYRANAKWLGNATIDVANEELPRRTESKIFYCYQADNGTETPISNQRPYAGLIIDEWNEKIPTAEENTGVSFHYNSPNNEAPQSLLLAVPPLIHLQENQVSWDFELVSNILNNTFEDVITRADDGEYYEDDGRVKNRIYDRMLSRWPFIFYTDSYDVEIPDEENAPGNAMNCLTDPENEE